MTARTRVRLLVAIAALAAAGTTVAIVALTNDEPGGERPAARPPAAPPLVLDLGVRNDAEARALRRAAQLYGRNRRDEAARIFARYDSPEARVGAALAAWPNSLDRLRALARERPRSGAVRLNLGLALATLDRRAGALRELRAAARVAPDSLYAIRADDVLHPRIAPGLPAFVPSFPPPSRLAGLSGTEQLALLAREARGRDLRAKLLYGTALQRVGRPVSARRVLDEAARLAPNDPEALTAAAVARFDKSDPSRAFGRLGPLTRRFPRAQTVRFHLGLMLIWLGDAPDARRQLQRARALDPTSPLGREAKRFLDRL